jgi:hypothetical protein
MRKFYLATAMFLGLAACGASPNGLLVSPGAEAVGGNLFVETLENGDQILVLDGEVTPDTSYVFQSLAAVDIFIAGHERSIAAEAELGLHSAEDLEFGLSVDRPYWKSFGFEAVNEAAYKVPFNDIWIVSSERAKELRLATEIIR